jgi:hypothetical protein
MLRIGKEEQAMRVRKRFWVLLGGVVLFALSLPVLSLLTAAQTSVPLHVAVYREPADDADDAACTGCSPRLLVQLTDAQGQLVDKTDLRSVADMAGMSMGPLAFRPQQIGQGLYLVQLSFSMPGSWWVRLDARAPNHQQASQTLTFWVQNIPQASAAEIQAIVARVRCAVA